MILYGMMRDRSLMSEKRPNFTDDDGVYVIFRRDDICSTLRCGHDKAAKILNELETFGLISAKHQGRNRPNKYYVENLLPEIRISDGRSSENQSPKSGLSDTPEVGKQDGIYIDLNSYKDISQKDSNQSICRYDPTDVEERIKENVEYDLLIQRDFRTKNDLPELINIMVDTVCCLSPTVKIGAEEYPRDLVRSRFLGYDSSAMEYVLDTLQKNTVKVNNIRSYLLKALFNAPTTLNNYYAAEVRHDLGY